MDENPKDLADQYQEILNQYASQITPPAETTETAQPTPPEQVPAPPPIQPPSPPPPEPPAAPPRPPMPLIVSPPPPEIPQNIPSAKSSNFFKYLFFFSFFVFLIIVGALIYTILSSQQLLPQNSSPSSQIQNSPTPAPTESINTSPEPVIGDSRCLLNDKSYGVGESFSAADNCNTCTCQEDLTIECTEKECQPSL